MDRDDGTWITMRRPKAEAHGLRLAGVELLRDGQLRCVIATPVEDRATVRAIHQPCQEKYAVQRLATAVGLFGREPSPDTVALRLDPCPDP